MPIIAISTLDDPRIAPYRHLKGADVMRAGPLFIAEGIRVVERLLASNYETDSLLLNVKRLPEWIDRIPDSVPVYTVPEGLGTEIVGFQFHVGVMAAGRRRRSPRVSDVFADPAQPLTVVLCPNCDNPENLGAILRISRAFGIDAVILGSHCCDPFARRVLRVSMGNALHVPVLQTRHWLDDLQWLRTSGAVTLAATTLDDKAIPLSHVTRPHRCGLLLGNEADGLDEQSLAQCDVRWTIPMRQGTDSLNVSVAAGIFLHHLTHGPASPPAGG